MSCEDLILYLYEQLNSSDLPIATLATDGAAEIGIELQSGEKYILNLQRTDRQL